MSLELNNVSSGYSTGIINENFQALEAYINDKLLNRDGTEIGEANQMELPLDMNSQPILNASTDTTQEGSLITVGEADARYVNSLGDTMQGSLDMDTYPLFVRIAVEGNEPARKDELDQERSERQSSDSSLQQQIVEASPLAAAERPVVQWHDQVLNNSLTIPSDKNAFSAGPEITLADGVTITLGDNTFYSILSEA